MYECKLGLILHLPCYTCLSSGPTANAQGYKRVLRGEGEPVRVSRTRLSAFEVRMGELNLAS